MTKNKIAKTTELYRHFDEDGSLLYVGISKCSFARFNNHKISKWYKNVVMITIERFATKDRAIIAERIAIIRENPLFNFNMPTKKDSSLIIEKYCDSLFTIKEAAKYLRITPQNLLYYVNRNRGPNRINIKPSIFIQDDLDAWEKPDRRIGAKK